MLKFVLINGRESSRKLPKVLAGKNLRMTQKASHTDLIKEKPDAMRDDAWAAAKHKIVLLRVNSRHKNI